MVRRGLKLSGSAPALPLSLATRGIRVIPGWDCISSGDLAIFTVNDQFTATIASQPGSCGFNRLVLRVVLGHCGGRIGLFNRPLGIFPDHVKCLIRHIFTVSLLLVGDLPSASCGGRGKIGQSETKFRVMVETTMGPAATVGGKALWPHSDRDRWPALSSFRVVHHRLQCLGRCAALPAVAARLQLQAIQLILAIDATPAPYTAGRHADGAPPRVHLRLCQQMGKRPRLLLGCRQLADQGSDELIAPGPPAQFCQGSIGSNRLPTSQNMPQTTSTSRKYRLLAELPL